MNGERPGGSVLAAAAAAAGAPAAAGRSSLRPVVGRLVVLLAMGVLSGALWWWLAPLARADVEQGSVFLRGHSELQAAQDCWFAIVLGAVGVLTATVHGWRSGGRGTSGRRAGQRRGAAGPQVQQLLGLTAAMAVVSVLAWATGTWLGPDDLAAQVADGAQHPLTPLQLHSAAALLVGPFLFVFTAFLTALFGAGSDRSG